MAWSLREAQAGAGFFGRKYSSWEGPHWRSSWRTVSCRNDPTLEQREEEGAMEKCYGLTTIPIAPGGAGGRRVMGKLEPGKKEDKWRRQVWFYFSLFHSVSNCQQIKLIFPNQVRFTYDSNWWVISPSWPQPVIFSPPVLLRRSNERTAPGGQPKLTHHAIDDLL